MTETEATKYIALWEAECEWARGLLRSSFLEVPENEAELVAAGMGACGALGRKGPRSSPVGIAEHANFIAHLRDGQLDAVCTCGREEE